MRFSLPLRRRRVFSFSIVVLRFPVFPTSLKLRAKKIQNLLDSQISWDFATNILKFSENDFRKVRNTFENKLDVRTKPVLTRS